MRVEAFQADILCETHEISGLDGAQECQSIMQSVERRLTKAAREAWRWRLLRLRSDIDAEIARCHGRMTLALDGMLEELVDIYCAQFAEDPVCPRSRWSLLRLKSL